MRLKEREEERQFACLDHVTSTSRGMGTAQTILSITIQAIHVNICYCFLKVIVDIFKESSFENQWRIYFTSVLMAR